jgi:sodium/proline symporter
MIVAKRLRAYTEISKDSLTLPDYFENRFRDDTHILRIFSALVILIFFTFYASSGLVSGAKLFESSFGLEYTTAIWVGVAVIVSYTFLGGFLAVSWTDFIQGILMLLALVIIPIVTFQTVGGWDAAKAAADAKMTGATDIFHDMGLLGILSLMAWGLGYFGQPHILTRFMALNSIKDAPRAMMIGMSWMIVSLIGACLTGFAAIAYFQSNPLEDGEKAFILLSQILFNPWVAGCLLAAILAAIMSTIDSQLLVSSSAITEDIYKMLLKKDASDKELVWIGRISVLVIAIVAALLATDRDSSVLSLVSYAWGGFGSAFGPLVILSLVWKGTTRNGAFAGIVIGTLTVILWKEYKAELIDVYELLPGFIFAFIAIIVVSLLDDKPSQEIQDEYEDVQKALKS